MAKKKILVVEDDADARTALRLRLQASGYDVILAEDGAKAIQAAQREHPNLVLLDLGLPAGDGFQVMERLRMLTTTATIPIVVLSAGDPGVHRPRALKAGAAAFFQKPADNDALLAEIRKQLGPEPEAAAAPERRQRKLMIVEDDADTLQGLSARLRAHGYETCSAPDGTTALRVARREKPDLILLDLGLPAGGGYLVLERLAAIPELSGTPLIVLSALDAAENRPRALRMGARAYFEKPADNEQLLRAISEALA